MSGPSPGDTPDLGLSSRPETAILGYLLDPSYPPVPAAAPPI